MTGLQTNDHVNGFGDYVKGGKVGCEKDRISIVLSFSSDDMVISSIWRVDLNH